MLFNEAANLNLPRIGYNINGSNVIKCKLKQGHSKIQGTLKSPWRYFIIADSPEQLLNRKYVIYKLNEKSEYDDGSWIKPGKVFRVMSLTTEGGKRAIDFAAKMNIQYIMFDAGWYGLGYGNSKESSPKSDPFKVINEINLDEVIEYGQKKDVGLILYLNKSALYNYDTKKLFESFKQRGVKGIKMGFMNGKSGHGIERIISLTKLAAQNNLLVNVHDEYCPSGLSKTYPNLLTFEGLRGNEYIDNPSSHTSLLPYIRFMSGAADYTPCYKAHSNQDRFSSLRVTKAHQLALSVVYFSPLQHIFWYGEPDDYTDCEEIEWLKYIPTTWDESIYLVGEIGKYVAVTRKKKNKWYLAGITDENNRNLKIPLSFLKQDKFYTLVSYEDSAKTIKKKTKNYIHAADSLTLTMKNNGGYVCYFEESKGIKVIAARMMKIKHNRKEGKVFIKAKRNEDIKYNLYIYNHKNELITNKSFYKKDEIDLKTLEPGMYKFLVKIGVYKVRSKKFRIKA